MQFYRLGVGVENVKATNCFRVKKWVGPGRFIGGETKLKSKFTFYTTNGHSKTRSDQSGKNFAVCNYKYTAIAGVFLDLVKIKYKLKIVREKNKPVHGILEFINKYK